MAINIHGFLYAQKQHVLQNVYFLCSLIHELSFLATPLYEQTISKASLLLINRQPIQ